MATGRAGFDRALAGEAAAGLVVQAVRLHGGVRDGEVHARVGADRRAADLRVAGAGSRGSRRTPRRKSSSGRCGCAWRSPSRSTPSPRSSSYVARRRRSRRWCVARARCRHRVGARGESVAGARHVGGVAVRDDQRVRDVRGGRQADGAAARSRKVGNEDRAAGGAGGAGDQAGAGVPRHLDDAVGDRGGHGGVGARASSSGRRRARPARPTSTRSATRGSWASRRTW